MKKIFTLLICTLFSAGTFAQSDFESYYHSNNELGINATSLMANIFNLDPGDDGSPFSIYYRRRLNKIFLRTGMNFNYNKSSDFDSNFNTVELTEALLHLRIGAEWGKQLGNRFMLFYGVDVFGGLESEISETFSITAETNQKMVGLGPAIRFEFKATKQIYLSTETHIYGTYIQQTDLVTGLADRVSDRYRLKLTLPVALFIGIQI